MTQVTAKKEYIKDENGSYIIPYVNPLSTTDLGVAKIDGVTITATPDGTISANVNSDWGDIAGNIQDQTDLINLLNNKTNIDLSNLTPEGNSKFQFASFSINNGNVDNNGDNNTLLTTGGSPTLIDVYVIPVLNANDNNYCDVSASGISYNTAYQITNSDVLRWTSTTGASSSATWTFNLKSDNHVPAGAECTITLSTTYSTQQSSTTSYIRNGCHTPKITFVYVDDSTEENILYSGILSTGTYTYTLTPTKEVTSILFSASSPSSGSANDVLQLYVGNLTINAKYNISSSDTLICRSCTITTADGKTKNFENGNLLDCSNVTDGTYKVMKSYTDGSLSLVSTLLIQKNVPAASSETAWTQPILSANGTMGGDSFAVSATPYQNDSRYAAWRAFDGDKVGSGSGLVYGYLGSSPIIFYNPIPIKVTKITAYNTWSTYPLTSFTVYGSNDNSNWTELGASVSVSSTIKEAEFENNNFYNYYKIVGNYSSSIGFNVTELEITATYQVQASETAWTQPVLSANGSVGGSDFACFASSEYSNFDAYKAFNGNTSATTANTYWCTATNQSLPQYIGFYNPQAIKVVNLRIYNQKYRTDNGVVSSGTIQASNDNITYTDISSFSGNTYSNDYIDVSLSNNNNYYKYYRISCTATTGANNYCCIAEIGITAYVGEPLSTDALWLDTSEYPLTLKQFDGINWQTNNDLVCLGDVTIASGVITSITNNEFNKYGYLLSKKPETYQNGTSWYRIYSGGWCEQGGKISKPTSTKVTVTLVKSYNNTNYFVRITDNLAGTMGSTPSYSIDTTSQFSIYQNNNSAVVCDWQACGYIKE